MRTSAAGASPPNVVGYVLEEAKAVLADAGWPHVETSETRPPRRALEGPQRVLRQRIDPSGRIALVVSGERPADAPATERSREGGGPPRGGARA
jgi:hypothetical protein